MGQHPTLGPGAHSEIGGSGIARLKACPGSFRLGRQAKQAGVRKTTIYAATGTVAHALAEDAMEQGYDPVREIGAVVTVDGHDVTVTQAMVDAVKVYIDLVELWKSDADWIALETPVVLDAYWSKKDAPPVSVFGTADALAYYGAPRFHLDVGDYKNGAGVYVEVIDSDQLLFYAAGALLKLKAEGREVRTVRLWIVQPNAQGGSTPRHYDITAVDVLMWVYEVLKPTVAEALKPNAALAAGKHCRFCPASVGCPARNKLRQEAAKRDFGPSNANLVQFTATQLSDALKELEILDDHAKALREHALERIVQGEKIPDWMVIPTRPTRSWDRAATSTVLHGMTGASALMFEETKLKTPAQVERLLGPEFWDRIKHLVVTKSSGVKLAPELENSTRNSPQDDFA